MVLLRAARWAVKSIVMTVCQLVDQLVPQMVEYSAIISVANLVFQKAANSALLMADNLVAMSVEY